MILWVTAGALIGLPSAFIVDQTRLEFLDLTTASETEKQFLEKILYNGNCPITLPCSASSSPEDTNSDAVVQWPGQQYDEERMEEVGTGSRGPIYHPQPYLVYYMPSYPTHAAPQFSYSEVESQQQQQPQHHHPQQQLHQNHHHIHNAQQPQQQPRSLGQRSMRKNEKKQEQQQQQSYPPIQMLPLQYSPVFQPPPFFHIAPPQAVYSDYHSNYIEHQAAPPSSNAPPVTVSVPALAPAAATPPVPPVAVQVPVAPVAGPVPVAPAYLEPEPIVTNVNSQPDDSPTHVIIQQAQPQPIQDNSIIPEFHTHEHMCYEETVTLKPPKKKDVITNETSSIEPGVASTETEVVAAGEGAGKSWAALFLKPLARVPPFDSSASVTKQERPATVASVNEHGNLADDPYIIRLSEYLKGYQLDHRATNITPRGLINHSNWCYVNAILQALIACPTFFNLLRGLPVPQNAEQAARIPITAAMIELAQCYALSVFPVRKKWEKHGRDEEVPTANSFEPKGVYRVLEKVRSDSGYSVDGRQEDAEEILSCLLNGLNDEMLEILKLSEGGQPTAVAGAATEPSIQLRPKPDLEPDDENQSAHDEWKVILPRNKKAITRRAVCGGSTPVSDIFRGQIRSHVQRAGDDASDSVQPFFTLQLDVEKTQSVKDALELLIGRDPLEGVTCTKTNKEVEAWTSSSIEDLPPILVLHLKCFDYKQDGCSKITKIVQFPIDLKIDTKLISPNSRSKYQAKQRNYKLVAVVYHDGKEATKGHYLTDAYHVGLGAWIRYDDGNVRRVGVEQVLVPQSPRVPYLLHYRRADTMASQSNKQSS